MSVQILNFRTQIGRLEPAFRVPRFALLTEILATLAGVVATVWPACDRNVSRALRRDMGLD